MVCAIRCTTWRTLPSPFVGSPWMPALRKYLETTMSVASCDHAAGISAPSILKTTEPSGFVIALRRRSQTTLSRGASPATVYRRSKVTPFFFLFAEGRLLGEALGCVAVVCSEEALFIDLTCPTT